MKLKISNKDMTLLEDELGNPKFKYMGNHPQEAKEFLDYIRKLERKIISLEADIDEKRYQYD